MKGYLASQGLHLGEHCISSSLSRVDPQSHDRRRQDAIDRSNPKPYIANYFGHKIHLDQNEKLIHFGVTRNCSRWLLRHDCLSCNNAN